ncbi:MAG: hypothetical protein KKC46_20425 [Proteobacteria bacterium]|nr:hypothetical protein [Pseudomonadota bacterium]
METFAVYWEPIIKTYDITERTGLSLISFDLEFNRICDKESWLTKIASRLDGSLILIFSRPALPSGLRLHLLFDRSLKRVEKINSVEDKMQTAQSMDINLDNSDGVFSGLRIDNPVELVYFQGPHYGDRYGIVNAAITVLAERKVPLIAAVCTGASVYLITPAGKAREAKNALGQAFSTPKTGKSEPKK